MQTAQHTPPARPNPTPRGHVRPQGSAPSLTDSLPFGAPMPIQIQAWDAAAVLDAARARTVATALDATPPRAAGRWYRMRH